MCEKYDWLEDEYSDTESFEPIERGMRREGEGESSRKKKGKKFNKLAREMKEFKPIYVEDEFDE